MGTRGSLVGSLAVIALFLSSGADESPRQKADAEQQRRIAWLRAHGYGASTIARAIKGDPDAAESREERRAGNRRTVAGNAGEPLEGPLSAAEEDAANRAYPLDSIPADAHENSRATFEDIELHEGEKDSEHGRRWRLIGPSSTTQPGVLSFPGADTHPSGRVTALAIYQPCTRR